MILNNPTLKNIHLHGKYDPEQLKEFRGNPILKWINDKPVAEFWKDETKPMPEKKDKPPDNG